MSPFEAIRMAASALAANRARSLLTVLSITIGAFAIVVMSSLAESGLMTLSRGIEDLGGARILLVWGKKPERGQNKEYAYAKGMRPVDRDRITRDLPHVAEITLYYEMDELEVMTDRGLRSRPSVIAGDAAFFKAFSMPIGRGRLFTDEDNRAHAQVCVIGKKLAENIFPAPAEPLGSLVTMGGLRCRVVGVLGQSEKFGLRFGFDWTNLIIVPSETMTDSDPTAPEHAVLFVKTDSPSANEIVKRLINARMEMRHPGLDDFTILDFAKGMEQFHMIFRIIETIVAVLAGIALFVGGVGVMNMMLVAVSERVQEIGLRKALGASPRTIGTQFLIESAMLSVFGGVVGVVLGLGVAVGASALIVRQFATWQRSLAPWSVMAALLVTFVIGIGFGWLPAKRAAALDPVEAMRR
jgi:putative ABC transport system permease protein